MRYLVQHAFHLAVVLYLYCCEGLPKFFKSLNIVRLDVKLSSGQIIRTACSMSLSKSFSRPIVALKLENRVFPWIVSIGDGSSAWWLIIGDAAGPVGCKSTPCISIAQMLRYICSSDSADFAILLVA